MKVHQNGTRMVIDPVVCHGAPAFGGTQILVADVLGAVAAKDDWDVIVLIRGGDHARRDC